VKPGDWGGVVEAADALLRRSERLLEESRAAAGGSWRPFSIQKISVNPKLSPVRSELARSGRPRYVAVGPFVASTYVSIRATCPSSCPFKDRGCYAQAGQTHLTMGRLDRAGAGMTPLAVTSAEADGLARLWPRKVPQDGARGGRDLRLHVGGETSCERGARRLAEAVEGLRARGLGAAWTYTHRWRTIPREAFGPISVLASVERPHEVGEAARRGYAAALTVPRFPDSAAFPVGDGFSVIPCPFESQAASSPTCAQCRLCFDDQGLLQRRRAIGFAVHGTLADAAAASLAERQWVAASSLRARPSTTPPRG